MNAAPKLASPKRQSPLAFARGLLYIIPVMTYSHIANATLPSARLRFTSVFGMDTGGTKALWSPGNLG